MNRMVDPESLKWAQRVLLLTEGGFIGNFIFSLSDHAGNEVLQSPGMGAGRGQRDRRGIPDRTVAHAHFAAVY